MGTKSSRSSGSQFNPKGVTQGNTLVDPNTGEPIDVITDSEGTRRLAVDANITAQVPEIRVELEYTEDSVQIGDPNTSSTLKINPNGSIDANVEIDAGDGDNIAIQDSEGHQLNINADGTINVVTNATGDTKSFYNEVTSVAASVLTTIDTYTAPMGKVTYLQKVEVSGTNIGEYSVAVNGVVQDKKRAYFGDGLNIEFQFSTISSGLLLDEGDIVTVRVIHQRPNVGDFNSRVQVVEV